ncbi:MULTISPECIES: hypothetical protein [Cyanophyceae]|nr:MULTISPECIES: hypothetical protein [unclassified Trichocoleus]
MTTSAWISESAIALFTSRHKEHRSPYDINKNAIAFLYQKCDRIP